MKEKLYDIMSDYNEILKDIDALVNVLEIEYKGVAETSATEITRSILKVHLRLLKGIQKDSEELYNKIDELNLSIKQDGE